MVGLEAVEGDPEFEFENFVVRTKHCDSSPQSVIVKDGIGWICGMHGEQNYIKSVENPDEEDHLGDLDLDERIILKFISEKKCDI